MGCEAAPLGSGSLPGFSHVSPVVTAPAWEAQVRARSLWRPLGYTSRPAPAGGLLLTTPTSQFVGSLTFASDVCLFACPLWGLCHTTLDP